MAEFGEMLRGLDGSSDDGPRVAGVALPEEDQLDDHARYDRATFAFETKDYGGAATLLEPLVAAAPGCAAAWPSWSARTSRTSWRSRSTSATPCSRAAAARPWARRCGPPHGPTTAPQSSG